jgi:hypothetical protein
VGKQRGKRPTARSRNGMLLGWLFRKEFVMVGSGLRWFWIIMNAADTPGMISRIIDILLIICY